MAADVASGMTDVDHIRKIEVCDRLGKVIGIGIQIVPMATARRSNKRLAIAPCKCRRCQAARSRGSPLSHARNFGLSVAFGEFHHIDGTVVGTVSEGVDARPERGADSEAG